MNRRLIFGASFLLLWSTAPWFTRITKPILAQEDFYVASTFELAGSDIENNDIVSRGIDGKLTRSLVNYDTDMFGVAVETAPMVYRTSAEGKPIARAGDVTVKITTLGGPIVIGDSITSSTIAGSGQRANNLSGYMLGTALEAFDGTTGTKTTVNGKEISHGMIKISLIIGPGKLSKSGVLTNLMDQFGSLLFRNVQTAEQTQQLFRYLVAGIISVAAFLIGFSAFGRNVTKGIEAIGRNPLAKQQIQAMIVLNIVLIVIVTIAGVALSLAIIRF